MSLRYILLLQRDVPKAARFFTEGLGLTARVVTEKWAELAAGDATVALKAADGCVGRGCRWALGAIKPPSHRAPTPSMDPPSPQGGPLQRGLHPGDGL